MPSFESPPPFYPNAPHFEASASGGTPPVQSPAISHEPTSANSSWNSNKRKKSSTSTENVTSNKLHQCPICLNSFSRLFNLTQHQVIHTGQRDYGCLEPDCTRSFVRSTDLTRHCKHVHKIDTRKEKRYEGQKKRLSAKNKDQSASVNSNNSNSNYAPPLSPSSSSSTSSENTNSTQASSTTSSSTSAFKLDGMHHSRSQAQLPKPLVVGGSSTRWLGQQQDYRGHPEEDRRVHSQYRPNDAGHFTLAPIKPTFPQSTAQAPPITSYHSKSQIVLPPPPPNLGPLSHQPRTLNNSFLHTSLASSTLSSHLQIPSNLIRRGSGSDLSATPTLPSIRTQLPFSFNGSGISNNSTSMSHSRTPIFERSSTENSRPLPPIRSSSQL